MKKNILILTIMLSNLLIQGSETRLLDPTAKAISLPRLHLSTMPGQDSCIKIFKKNDDPTIKNHPETADLFKQVLNYKEVDCEIQKLTRPDEIKKCETKQGLFFDKIEQLFGWRPGCLHQKARPNEDILIEVLIQTGESEQIKLGVSTSMGIAKMYKLTKLTNLFNNPAYRQDKEACCIIL